MDDLAERVIGILAAQALLDPADIDLTAAPESLGLDSLGLVEAIFAIEEAFDITVPFNPGEPDAAPAFDISSVGRMVAAVEQLVAQKPQ